MDTEKDKMDKINMDRVETTRRRVAHSIKLLANPLECMVEGRVIDTAVKDIAHAINLLEAGEEELRLACNHFQWDPAVCEQIDNAVAKLGQCIVLAEDEDNEPDYAGIIGVEGMTLLSKSLATLIRWNDEDADCSEI